MENFPPMPHPKVILGVDDMDDAGVYLLREDLALVQTVDFFSPIVDDPYAFGQIAAANSLSDIYAMGAEPITALNIIAFPEGDDPGMDVLGRILLGGRDKCEEAGVPILGGHSVDDKEPKYGLAVTGIIHPDDLWSKSGARPGDKLILTKPLGTGILATAIKKGAASPDQIKAVIETASGLNKSAAEAGRKFSVHAATDVTGFGLVNHLLDICKMSKVGARINYHALPVLDGVLEFIRQDVVPGGSRRNRNHAGLKFIVNPALSDSEALVACDAQTSGGILFAVSAEQAEDFVAALIETKSLAHAVIGEITDSPEPVVRLEP